jgi:hypothetical protein
MAITLNHTIVPARDKEVLARFFAHVFGLQYEGPTGHFAPVRVNESLTSISIMLGHLKPTTMRFMSVTTSAMRFSRA